MKNKLKPGWIPKWQQTWNTLPLAAGQDSRDKVRRHPKPTYHPDLTNHDRMKIRHEARTVDRELSDE